MAKRQFVKYMNRKLYDSDNGHYITMEGLDEVVAAGEEIAVTEDRTGSDITTFVLARLVYDRCRVNKDAFDQGELKRLLTKKRPARREAA